MLTNKATAKKYITRVKAHCVQNNEQNILCWSFLKCLVT